MTSEAVPPLTCIKCGSTLVTSAEIRTQADPPKHRCRMCGCEFAEAERKKGEASVQ